MADVGEQGAHAEQSVVVPWEWVGPPGEEKSAPIFGQMALPTRFGRWGPRRRRELGLPAPGEATSYRFELPRAGVGRLTYRYQGQETTQLVPLVKGRNVVVLRREDEPTT